MMITERQAELLQSIIDTPHYSDAAQHGRVYYLKPNGIRRYVKHDPIAVLMRRGMITSVSGMIDDNTLIITSLGRAILNAYPGDKLLLR